MKTMQVPTSDHERDGGYTLVELMVTIALLSTLMAIAVSGWSSWAKASAHSGTAREIQSAMRQAQQQAVTEGRAMCVWFDGPTSFTVFRGRCSDATKEPVLGPVETPPHVQIASPSFTSSAGTATTGVSFHGRGTASPGAVRITRSGSSKVYTITVEGLTGRVSVS
jgi:prepilin-type N-terminal cleavage/methylation domain-containing protein